MSDPFTLSVIESALEYAADEMFEVLRKTAMSPIIYEVLDVGTGITDADGALVSSGAGIPSFVGVLDKSVKAILAQAEGEIAEGDVFLVNDPNRGGVTHLNDMVVAEPVFFEGQRVAWVASIAHWGDIGGRTPGSMSTEVTEIVAEGLRLPVVRLFRAGVRNEAIADIIMVNSRLPDFVTGDLWAQVSAGRRAAGLLRILCQRYGVETLQTAIVEAREVGRRRALAGLARLPKGRFEVQQRQDDGAVCKAVITITDERFEVDVRGAPPAATGPYNTSREGTLIACQILFKALTDPNRYANAGSFMPLELVTEPGTIFDPGPDAAHGYYFETRIRLVDMLWRCIAGHAEHSLPAGHFASIFGTVIAGLHPDTGRRFTMVEPQMGGWGATPERPGNDAMFSTNHGDTFNCPVEVAEARYGFDVVSKRLGARQPSPDGDDSRATLRAEHPGGRGVDICYRMRGPAVMSVGLSHGVEPVWSLDGAQPGGLNQVRLRRGTAAAAAARDGGQAGEEIMPCFFSNLRLEEGDEVVLSSASGGNALRAD